MRFNEILLEYNRAITAKQTNAENLLKALISDRSIQLPPELGSIKSLLEVSYLRILKSPELPKFVESILAAIEDRDPTPNNEYTPWLARMYSKGGVKYEDLNRMNLLGLFHLGKKKKNIHPEHRDINRFKTYNEFENVIIDNYPPEAFEEEEGEKPQARKVFENDEVVIIIPENEAAACKYGRQTRWCTAATQGKNYFNDYNSKGPLYILIPKKPEYEGEKYQLHFETKSFMDEGDESVNLRELLTVRFPSLDEFFMDKTKEEVNQDNWHTRFYKYGELHREDGPAVVANDGTEERWFNHGKLHREDGPAVILYSRNGNVIDKAWFIDGKRHRTDGPAYIQDNGYREWWVDGRRYTEIEYNNLIKNLKTTGKI